MPDTYQLKPSPPLRLQVITDRSAFALLGSRWNAMLMEIPGATPFMTWEWLDTWMEEYCRADQQLLILTAWDGPRLVAGLPLLFSQQGWAGVFKVRQLELVGTGEPEWEEVCGEYNDLIAQAEQMPEAVALFATYLQALPWDKFVLRKILDGSLLMTRLVPFLSSVSVVRRSCGHRYRVALPREVDGYRRSLSRRMLRRIRRAEKLKASPTIEIEIVDDVDTLAKALLELRALHQTRWQQAGKPGAFQSTRFSRFHDKVALSFLRAGWLQLQRITDNGKAILINYNVRFGNAEYYYQSGFDIEKYRNYSLGVMAHLRAIECAIDDGLIYYDFMHSVGDSYKQQYLCQLTPMEDLTLIKATLPGKWLLFVDFLTQRMRRLRMSVI